MTADTHDFDLPDWGTGGAPDVTLDDDALAEVEVRLEGADPPLITTVAAPQGVEIRKTIGFVSGQGSSTSDSSDTAAAEARVRALAALSDNALAMGAQAVVGTRLYLTQRKNRALAVAYGTAVSIEP